MQRKQVKAFKPSDRHVAEELSFMQKKGAPKSMIKAEKKEHGVPFAEGGGITEGENKNIDAKTRGDALASVAAAERGAEEFGAGAEPTSFKDAFAAARKSGVSTFEWKGKKFNTDLAPAKRAAPTVSIAAASSEPDYSNEGRGKRPAKPSLTVPPDEGPKGLNALQTIIAERNAKRRARGGYADGGMVFEKGTIPRVEKGVQEALGETPKVRVPVDKKVDNDAFFTGPDEKRAANRRKGPPKELVDKYAKGGSIDGCALRGKTRLARG